MKNHELLCRLALTQLPGIGIVGAHKLLDATEGKAAMLFGWLNLCAAQVEDMPTIHAQVRRIYEDICNRAEEQRKYGLLARSDVAGYIAGEAVQ